MANLGTDYCALSRSRPAQQVHIALSYQTNARCTIKIAQNRAIVHMHSCVRTGYKKY